MNPGRIVGRLARFVRSGAACLIAISLLGLTPSAAAGDPATSFHWAATGLTGDFAARVTFSFPVPTQCTLDFLTAGVFDEWGLHHYYARDDAVSPWGMVIGGSAVNAHVAGVSPTNIVHEDGFISAHSIVTSAYYGSATWTFAGFRLQPFEGSLLPGTFEVKLECGQQFQAVFLEASREVVGKTPDQLEQGTGASLITSVGGGVSTADGFARTSTAPKTVVRFYTDAFRSETDLTITYPGGTERRHFQNFGNLRLESGPGVYQVAVSRAWVGFDTTVFVLFGFHPVFTLDDWPELPSFN